jgi:hypothetical protein
MGSDTPKARFIREKNINTLLRPSIEENARKESSFTCWEDQLPNLQYSQATKTGQRWSIWFNRNCIGKLKTILHLTHVDYELNLEILNPKPSCFLLSCSILQRQEFPSGQAFSRNFALSNSRSFCQAARLRDEPTVKKPANKTLDGEAGCDTGVHNCSGMGHNAPSLEMSETVHECAHGPLNHSRQCESHEAKRRPQNSTMARIPPRPAFEAQRHKRTAGWIRRSSCLRCKCIH